MKDKIKRKINEKKKVKIRYKQIHEIEKKSRL